MAAEGSKRRSKFFWFEGVTEAEVVRSLSDTRPTRLRQQGPRRTLVIAMAVVLAAMALIGFVTESKLTSYLEFGLIAVAVVLYTLLRKAVRLISDAPDELLDERQIAVRDAAHTVAYRALALVGSVVIVLHLVLRHPHGTPAAVASADGTMLLIAFVMSAAFLPAMVLAWNLPSEQADA
ncbi:MAG: hypothetical protein ACK5F5_09420 [Gammaproteobacteria bacterium]|jgi:hypothetical protein